MASCSACGGRGYFTNDDGSTTTCGTCNGSGWIDDAAPAPSPSPGPSPSIGCSARCAKCGGRCTGGAVKHEYHVCENGDNTW